MTVFFNTSIKLLERSGRLLKSCIQSYKEMSAAPLKVINFNTKHLKKGDPLPPYNGDLRVYNMRYCPYAQRTILALNAKGIHYEVVNINLVEKPEWLTQKSAFAKVPALEISDGISIYESLITVEYLDDVYPQRRLLPSDPVQKAFDKIIVEAAAPINTIFYKQVRSPETITADTVAAYHKALGFIEEQLKCRWTAFLGGSQPGFADYMIWPWFERVLIMQKNEKKLEIPERFSDLVEYLKKMYKDPAVSSYLVPDDVMNTFLDAFRLGNTPNYDLMLEQ